MTPTTSLESLRTDYRGPVSVFSGVLGPDLLIVIVIIAVFIAVIMVSFFVLRWLYRKLFKR